MFEGKKMEASFATNKYCQKYLQGRKCTNRQCNFIHEEMPISECFIKERSLDNRDIFQSQKTYAYNAIRESADFQKIISEGDFQPQQQMIGGNRLPTINSIVHKVRQYFREREIQSHRSMTFCSLSESSQKKHSAFEKIKRNTDCKKIADCIDYHRAEENLKRRSQGFYYRFNLSRNGQDTRKPLQY